MMIQENFEMDYWVPEFNGWLIQANHASGSIGEKLKNIPTHDKVTQIW